MRVLLLRDRKITNSPKWWGMETTLFVKDKSNRGPLGLLLVGQSCTKHVLMNYMGLKNCEQRFETSERVTLSGNSTRSKWD
jgi:hypothetical protein